MLFLLLKNKRLRLEQFLGLLLLLMIGTMPNGCEGLDCYKCWGADSCKNKPEQLEITYCSEGEVCKLEVTKGVVDQRDCVTKSSAEEFGCVLTAPVIGSSVSRCLCNKPLCNVDEKTANYKNMKKGGGPGQPSPNGKLIWTILITPAIFYGYLGRGMAAF